MESYGTPGRIQITRATYELLADDFECEPRGSIAVKGKGEVETWYLVRPREERPSASADEARETTVADLG
jgi:adenylate cyclase